MCPANVNRVVCTVNRAVCVRVAQGFECTVAPVSIVVFRLVENAVWSRIDATNRAARNNVTMCRA